MMPKGIYIRTKPPYWLGKSRDKNTKRKISNSLMGTKHSEESKKKRRGENHYRWNYDRNSYYVVHSWVTERLGRPDTCEHCGKSGLSGRNIHWANKSGLYLRDVNDWIRLCVSCHTKYDKHRVKL